MSRSKRNRRHQQARTQAPWEEDDPIDYLFKAPLYVVFAPALIAWWIRSKANKASWLQSKQAEILVWLLWYGLMLAIAITGQLLIAREDPQAAAFIRVFVCRSALAMTLTHAPLSDVICGGVQ